MKTREKLRTRFPEGGSFRAEWFETTRLWTSSVGGLGGTDQTLSTKPISCTSNQLQNCFESASPMSPVSPSFLPILLSVVQLLSHVWLFDPMACSTPGFPVLHCLLEFAQIHVHWSDDVIQASSVTLVCSCLQPFPASESFPMSKTSIFVVLSTGENSGNRMLKFENNNQQTLLLTLVP